MLDNENTPDEQDNNELNESLTSDITDDSSEQELAKELDAHITEELSPEIMVEDVQTTKEPEFVIDNDITEDSPVTVQPVKFTSFDEEENKQGKENKNLDLLLNVNLQMSVELGRTELPFKKVLELTRGSIISLDKLAGEPVELFANGKLVAFGEVVVIEDNFGLRITSIAAPEERLRTVHETTD